MPSGKPKALAIDGLSFIESWSPAIHALHKGEVRKDFSLSFQGRNQRAS
jgi:hypothetical protein